MQIISLRAKYGPERLKGLTFKKEKTFTVYSNPSPH
uniref:Uncharacterized protein n=1 Tax=Anguilla anguilla TaxID=7936 RepID=A0A0E9RUV0_ANGAN